MWRVLNREDITDFKVFNYQGFNVAMGVDPVTGSHTIVYLEYYKSAYTPEELADPSSAIGSSIKKKFEDCLICNTMNQLAATNGGISPMDQASAQPQYQPIQSPPVQHVSPVQQGHRVSAGDMVMPKYIPALTNIGQQVWCTKLGSVATSVILSAAADLLAGWSSDPGQKAAFRQISDEFVDGLQLCSENDVNQLKKEIAKLYDSYSTDGNLGGAVRKSMFKSAEQALRDQGIEVKTSKQSTR